MVVWRRELGGGGGGGGGGMGFVEKSKGAREFYGYKEGSL